jgi:hypothetical protein
MVRKASERRVNHGVNSVALLTSVVLRGLSLRKFTCPSSLLNSGP